MRLEYRQGLVKFQTDSAGNPTFLLPIVGGSKVSLIVSPETTLITFAHGQTSDYLHEENVTVNGAWDGPFTTGTDFWLFWDLNLITGERTFNHTLLNPITSFNPPPTPAQGQHWFSLESFNMNERVGNRWVERVRVFAAKYDNGSILVPFGLTSQVGLNNPTKAGFLLFDPDGDPIKKFDRFNRGVFHTTETPLSSQTARQSNFRLEAAIVEAEAIEHIPKFFAVAYVDPALGNNGKLALARQDDIEHPAVGVAQEAFFVSERRSFISRGHIRDRNFNFTEPVNTPLFVGTTGELTSIVPQAVAIQQVATIVSPKVIYVDIQPQIIYG